MERTKKIAVLVGALVILSAATLVVSGMEQKKEEIRTNGEAVLQIPGSSVNALSWEREEAQPLSFHREGEEWIYDDDPNFPVSERRIEELLDFFEMFGAAFVIENVEEPGQYGLDNPAATICLETAEQNYEIQIGDYSKMDAQRYVSIGNGNVYLAVEDPLTTFNVTLHDLIENDTVPVWDTVQSISFSGTENYTISFQEEGPSYREADHWFVDVNGKMEPLDPYRVDNYLMAIQALYLTDFVTYSATEQDIRSYGLDAPELTIQVAYQAENQEGELESKTFQVAIGRDPAERGETAEDEDDADIIAYARIGESPIIYQIPGYDYEQLMMAGYNDLRYQQIFPAAFQEILWMDVTLEGQQYHLSSSQEDGETVWSYQDEIVEHALLEEAVSALLAETFTEEQPTGKMEIAVTAALDHPEKPEIRVELYRYDGNSCLAVVDGAPYGLVERAKVVDLMEAVNTIVLEESNPG